MVKTKAGEVTVKELKRRTSKTIELRSSILPARNARCRHTTWCGWLASSGRASNRNTWRARMYDRQGYGSAYLRWRQTSLRLSPPGPFLFARCANWRPLRGWISGEPKDRPGSGDAPPIVAARSAIIVHGT